MRLIEFLLIAVVVAFIILYGGAAVATVAVILGFIWHTVTGG